MHQTISEAQSVNSRKMKIAVKFCLLIGCGGVVTSSEIEEFKGKINLQSKLIPAASSCELNDRDLNECIRKSFQENFPKLHNPSGNPKFPLIDPFFFDFGQIFFNRTGRASGTFAIKNMTVLGGNSVKFDNLRTSFNDSDMVITTTISVPQVKASGWFKSDLVINSFSFVSRGKFKLTCDEITAKFIIAGHFKENRQRFMVDGFEMLPTVKNMRFDITHLVADNNLSTIKIASVISFFSCSR